MSNISSMIDEQIGDEDFDLNGDLDLGSELGEEGDVSDLDNEESGEGQEEEEQSQPTNKAQPSNDPAGEKPTIEGIKKVGNDYVDNKGNIVDKDGKVLAAAGKDRRHYEENVRFKAENNTLRSRLDQAEKLVQQSRDILELPQKLGLSTDEYRDALEITKLFSTDPVKAAKEVVARALALGHNVTDILGKDVGDSVDMVALRRMQEDLHSRPAREQAERERAEQELNSRAMTQYNEFIAKYPDSLPHEDAIANLMAKGDNAEVAYFKVRSFAIENGLDFSQPLGPQIRAKAERNVQTADNRRTPAPMNGGRGRTSERRMTDKPVEASANSSFADIIRSTLNGN